MTTQALCGGGNCRSTTLFPLYDEPSKRHHGGVTKTALLLIDVQRGFDDERYWGTRNNPNAEANMRALLDAWQVRGLPVILVRHNSVEPESPLRAHQRGNEFKPALGDIRADLVFGKSVNSAFLGDVDLHQWLRKQRIDALVLAGIQTNFCCETTARMGGNLGYKVTFVLDATYTFDIKTPDGDTITADELSRVTAANLCSGGFATVRDTTAVLAKLEERV
jgi:nicotinamidase-related amidase